MRQCHYLKYSIRRRLVDSMGVVDGSIVNTMQATQHPNCLFLLEFFNKSSTTSTELVHLHTAHSLSSTHRIHTSEFAPTAVSGRERTPIQFECFLSNVRTPACRTLLRQNEECVLSRPHTPKRGKTKNKEILSVRREFRPASCRAE